MAWINPKIDWANGDTLASTDFNRIEANILELKNGQLDTSIADGRYLKLAGGTITGSLTVNNSLIVNNNRIQITRQGAGAELLLLNTERAWSFKQGGTGAESSLDLISSSDGKSFRIFSASGVANSALFRVNDASVSLELKKGNITVSSGTITASGNITSNGGEFILNNDKRFKGKAKDGTATTLVYISTGDQITLGNGSRLVKLHGEVLTESFIRSNNITGSTGGIAFSSGGSVGRRLFIGTNTDWSGGQPKGGTFGDIWIRV